ncbi:MAG: sulfatase-like hydrolase/transferase [Candidatus Aminicenantes bacterium]|nr:sulfatase-like hydrolase/transferase [Candidatus Aminicenantes bacterium]
MNMDIKRFISLIAIILFCSSLSYSTNVIIIAVDTLRADHLGCYGYERNTSPNIDDFARDGVLFTRCYTPSPLTTPAFASMLSSLPPYKHGAKRNGMSIFDKTRVLPQFLRREGYYSGAVISNWTLRKKLTELNRGFDTYTEVFTKRRWLGVLNAEGDAEEVNDAARRWIYHNANRKFFFWVHYTEPHEPYVYRKEFDLGYKEADPSLYPPGSDFKKIRKYDTEIGYDDFFIGELIKRIKELGLYEDSLIIFMADHGESFGEHDYYGHGRKLYNSCLHVPLIVKLPGSKNANTVIDRNVSILDIAPTILSLLELPIPEDMEGDNLFEPKNENRVLYFEAYRGAVDRKRGKTFQLKVEPIRHGLLSENIKLIHDNGFEAYDVEKDRFETKNVYKNPDGEMAELTDLLKKFMIEVNEFIKYSMKYFRQKSTLTKEDIEKLKSLGYIKQ